MQLKLDRAIKTEIIEYGAKKTFALPTAGHQFESQIATAITLRRTLCFETIRFAVN